MTGSEKHSDPNPVAQELIDTLKKENRSLRKLVKNQEQQLDALRSTLGIYKATGHQLSPGEPIDDNPRD